MMKNNYFKKCMICLVMLMVAGLSHAVGYPKYPVQKLEDGKIYVLVNLANPSGYMCRTTWDNALVMQGRSEFDSQYGVKLTAHQDQELGLWYFTTSEEFHEAVEADPENEIEASEAYTSYTYLGIPGGTNNVRAMQVFDEIPYFEITDGITDGFYKLRVAQGHQHTPSIGVFLHLNGGGTYPVANEPTNSWYPDFYGGVALDEEGAPIIIYDEESGYEYKQMADSTSCNWGFVNVEDIDAYNEAGKVWANVNTFAQSDYCNNGSAYEAGFLLTLAEAERLMAEGDMEGALAVIAAKQALYRTLEAAMQIAEEAGLEDMVEAAEKIFNEQVAADAVTEASNVLEKACSDYQMGLGYITAMGQNMSFEDLSSQGGNATSGVAGAPTGWNVIINGKAAVTEADVRAAGISAWHGINADCYGHKDGNNGFGLWNGTVPQYELNQTITGLDNGTYTISCGLMVGANGNGSRRTTQRVFGNFNTTLFASESDYAEDILPGELKGYAGLEEPVTDGELQEISVRAYVYDGTLTFGIRTDNNFEAALRDGANGAGGDGWFKVDNFTIYKEGFDANDQQNVYDFLAQTLSALSDQPMDKNFKESLTNIDNSDMDKAIASMGGLIQEIESQTKAYDKLRAALDVAYGQLENCEENGYKGTLAFADIISDTEANYYDGEYSMEQIAEAVAALEQAYQDCLHSGVDEGADVSDLIVNRSFEDLQNQGGNNSDGVVNAPYGWTLKLNGVECQTADEIRAQGVTAWCAINSGDNINVEENGMIYNHQYTDGTHVWGIWNASIPQVELSQKITGLNPGTYVLTADVMARNTDWSGHNLTTQRIFAQDVICLYGSEDDYDCDVLDSTSSSDIYKAYDLSFYQGILLDEEEEYEFLNYAGWNASDNDILLRRLELHFGVGEDGEATIGFRTDNLDAFLGEPRTEQAAGWFKLDNFTLYYESSKIPENMTVGIKAPVTSQTATAKAIYDLSGRKVSKTEKGVYIMQGKKIVK